jgi:hypothetical protein
MHVPTRKQLPLGFPTDLEDIRTYIVRQLDRGDPDEISFSTISSEVFVR